MSMTLLARPDLWLGQKTQCIGQKLVHSMLRSSGRSSRIAFTWRRASLLSLLLKRRCLILFVTFIGAICSRLQTKGCLDQNRPIDASGGAFLENRLPMLLILLRRERFSVQTSRVCQHRVAAANSFQWPTTFEFRTPLKTRIVPLYFATSSHCSYNSM